jgi:hypothetical protein
MEANTNQASFSAEIVADVTTRNYEREDMTFANMKNIRTSKTQ